MKKIVLLLLLFLLFSQSSFSQDILQNEWVLWRMNGAEDQRHSEITMSFDTEEGLVTGNCFCNVYRAPYEYDGHESMTVQPLLVTKRICGQAEDEATATFKQTLATMDHFQFFNGNLHIMQGDRAVLKFYSTAVGEPYPEEPEEIYIPEPEPEPEPIPYLSGFAYRHDASGNRIVREAVIYFITPRSTKSAKGADEDKGEANEYQNPDPVTASLGLFELTVYPNPTTGLLKVQVQGDEAISHAELNLYNTHGKKLYKNQSVHNMYELDISSYASGIYILQMVLNGKSYEWKVIKE